MRIILNSDVLHVKRLRKIGLAGHIDRFCREAAASGAILVLPRTVLLENERNQRQLYDKALAELQAAASVLRFWGIAVPEHDAQDMIKTTDLSAALRATGIAVEIHDPTLDDYRDAEYRACLHEAPQASNAGSDEMRDLVIWAVAGGLVVFS